jgi:hypothetical protein
MKEPTTTTGRGDPEVGLETGQTGVLPIGRLVVVVLRVPARTARSRTARVVAWPHDGKK